MKRTRAAKSGKGKKARGFAGLKTAKETKLKQRCFAVKFGTFMVGGPPGVTPVFRSEGAAKAMAKCVRENGGDDAVAIEVEITQVREL